MAANNRISVKAGIDTSGSPIIEDKNGQEVVSTGAGTAKKQTVSNDLYMVDGSGQKVLATSGKDTYALVEAKEQTVSSPVTGTTDQPTEVPGDAQTSTPTTNTGTGTSTSNSSNISSMLGGQSQEQGLTNSWDKEAKQYADKLYQQGKAEAESEYSVKASELKTQAQQSQEELEMQKYTNAQTSDKLGWTGGYVLDQQRQMNVLKAGIQAQLFNTQELNKLGLESSLAAARLNADLKNQELAHQYYQDAVNNAINQAQVTGYYLSPEASDYLTQQRAAEQIMATADKNSAEYAQAQSVISYVENYFSENGLSKQGTKTLSYLQYELSQEQADREAKQLELSYIMASQQSTAYTEGTAGLYVDENGKTVFAGATDDDPYGSGPDLVNFSSITSEKLQEICNMNAQNASFYEQCIDYKLGEIAKLYNNFLSTQGLTASEDSWKKFQENPTNKALIDNFNAIKDINTTAFDKETVLNGSAVPSENFTLDANLNITFTTASKQTGNVDSELQAKLDQVDKNTSLTDEEKLQQKEDITNTYNEQSVAKNTSASVNADGDTFNNNAGDRKSGNNFSITLNGTIYRVENGKKVTADSDTWKALNAISKQTGAVVTYKNAIYVRDTTTWYIVQARANSYKDSWKNLCEALGVDGDNRSEDLE